MRRTFKETPTFTKKIDDQKDPDALRRIQNSILENPDAGATVAGTGGVRKMRASDPSRNKGKRGGLRVIYLDLPDQECTYLIYCYGKDEADNLTAREKKQIKELVSLLKGE